MESHYHPRSEGSQLIEDFSMQFVFCFFFPSFFMWGLIYVNSSSYSATCLLNRSRGLFLVSFLGLGFQFLLEYFSFSFTPSIALFELMKKQIHIFFYTSYHCQRVRLASYSSWFRFILQTMTSDEIGIKRQLSTVPFSMRKSHKKHM